MEVFTGFEYLLLDAAGHMGLDKTPFSHRLDWANAHLDHLESLTEEAKKPDLYHKSVLAIRKAQRAEATGHRVGFDACSSGMQIMSTLTGCYHGAKATGLVDPNERPDAYKQVTEHMNTILHAQGIQVDIKAEDAKTATMTAFYGSKEQPKKIFGVDTPELAAFHQAVQEVAPGAYELLQDLLGSWQPFTLMHRWVLPDGYVARVKVMQKVEKRIEVDELDHATFTYQWYQNEGAETGLSNVANVIHSVDAYVLRSLIRRCSYDPEVTRDAMNHCFTELLFRDCKNGKPRYVAGASETIQKYVERFEATDMVDAVIIPYLDLDTCRYLSDDHLRRLNQMMEEMLDHPPFPLTSVHDEFLCHANHMNVLRQQYVNVFAEMADSTILDDIFQELTGTTGTYRKLSSDLSQHIRGSNYALS